MARKNSILVRQSAAGECGVACIAMLCRHYRDGGDTTELRRKFPTSSRGASLKDLVFIADQLGFHSRALKSDIPSLSALRLPVILHWDLNHFVVLTEIRRSFRGIHFRILDPASGIHNYTVTELSAHFTGVVLELTPTTEFRPKKAAPLVRLTDLWSRIQGFWPATGQVFALSIVLQLITLAMPFYMRLAIDTVLPAMDLDLMNILAIGFGLLLAMSAVTSWVRVSLVLNLSFNLSLQTAANLFRHVIYLPIAWFGKRHLGDVVSRFGSLQPISDLMSKGLVSAVVDGVLAVMTLVLMFIYSPLLTTLSLSAVVIYGAMKIGYFTSLKHANANVLTAQAVESTVFMENIRGINAIKVFCQEQNRQRHWLNKKVAYTNSALKLGRLTGSFDVLGTFIVALEGLIFFVIAVRMIGSGALTLGMVFALQAYKQSFMGAIVRLIDQLMNYRLLDVHLSRISDLVREDPEPEGVSDSLRSGFNEIKFQNVCFSYGAGLAPTLQNVNFTICRDSFVAIVGPSGSGKTTLLKMLCGLLMPTAGKILIDGVPLSEYGIRNMRSQLGVVCQEDTLFSGTLAENIAFFDPNYTIDRVARCAGIAAVHRDIARMPMKYETPVGDMGSNLSGGQKQRLLIARALYSEPNWILLDEATAHLDVRTESVVIENLCRHRVGRVMVAHRPDAYSRADRILRVDQGSVIEEVKRSTEDPAAIAS